MPNPSLGELFTQTWQKIDQMKLHICLSGEYNVTTLVPTVDYPEENTFYLVPDGTGNNVYTEWVYINDNWERFGQASIDLSTYAPKIHPQFLGTISMDRQANSPIGDGSIAIGHNNVASGQYSYAEGSANTASSSTAHAEGYSTIASNSSAHAEGHYTKAYGAYSHAEGEFSVAQTEATHAEGYGTSAVGQGAHAEGQGNSANKVNYNIYINSDILTRRQSTVNAQLSGAIAQATHAEGYLTRANSQKGAHAEGCYTIADGYQAPHAEGVETYVNCGNAGHAEGVGTYAAGASGEHAEGVYTYAGGGGGGHAEGVETISSGMQATHAEGYRTQSTGEAAHSEGKYTKAMGTSSHAEGIGTITASDGSHAEGYGTWLVDDQTNTVTYYGTSAVGQGAHAEGYSINGSQVYARGRGSHAEGTGTDATGDFSHAEGSGTKAVAQSSHVAGEYNVEDSYESWPSWKTATEYHVGDKVKIPWLINNITTSRGYICNTDHTSSGSYLSDNSSYWDQDYRYNFVEIIGNGNNNTHANARALTWLGDERLAGNLYVNCNADSTGGSKVISEADYATDTRAGIVKVATSGTGLYCHPSSGELSIAKASSAAIKNGTNQYSPIVPSNGHEAIFYGLAKAAGDSTQAASDNAIGTYTDNAKTAIQSMLGIGMADTTNAGLVKVNAGHGIAMDSDGVLQLTTPTASQLQALSNGWLAPRLNTMHTATFYSLAKAAGDTTQSISNNAVGLYTDNAKIAIQKMLFGYVIGPKEEIITYIVAEDSENITINTDNNGNPFQLVHAQIAIYLNEPTTQTQDYITARLLVPGASDETQTSEVTLPTLKVVSATGNNNVLIYSFHSYNGLPEAFGKSTSAANSQTPQFTTYMDNYNSVPTIRTIKYMRGVKFSQYSSTTTLIPAGSKIIIYGCRYYE